MGYCRYCGNELSNQADFCSSCGAKVDKGYDYQEKKITVVETVDIKERNVVVSAILYFITFGIYGLYWMVKLNDESLKISKENGLSGIVVILLNIITLGIYGWIWAYKMGGCMDKIKGDTKGKSDILYLVIAIVGWNFINMILMQDTINRELEKIK